MTSETPVLSDLADALARGRLTIAEASAIPEEELDTLFEVAAERLDIGHEHEAAELFRGLLTLFPYSARYWRGYGITLHRLQDFQAALAAYDASLLLDSRAPAIQCYRAEILVYLGRLAEASQELEALSPEGDTNIHERKAALVACITALSAPDPATPAPNPEPPPTQPATENQFVLPDGRQLPLADGRFTVERDEAIPIPVSTKVEEPTRPLVQPGELRRAQGTRPEPLPTSRTFTAIVPRPRHSAHAQLPQRSREVTQTAIVRRRSGRSLSDEITQTFPSAFFQPEDESED